MDTSFECKNLKSTTVDELLEKEVQKGFVKGPFDSLEFPTYRVSPLGLATGKYWGEKTFDFRLVFSSPKGRCG
jgi:hypothetical protein